MQTIDITDFWINRPSTSGTNNFSILSDRWAELSNCRVGNGKAYYYSGLVDKWQLKCIVIDDTFYFDFSASPITDVIKQQMWILKHTKNVGYKIEFVCLWEMFKLPTIEQLNEFAKIKQEVVVPNPVVQSAQSEYDNAVEEMRLSTSLSEHSQVRNIHFSLSEYVELMRSMYHTRLSNEGAVNYATIIHNYHNPVVQPQVQSSEDLYNDSLQVLVEASGMNEATILPEDNELLETYIDSLSELDYNDEGITYEEVVRHATNIYNYHRSTQPEPIRFEDLDEEVITEEELYRDALQAIADTSGLETDEFLPLSTTSLNDYLDWVRDITDLPEDGVVNYGTIVYNYHRENEYVIVEDLADEVTEAGQINHPF